jgi:hypothetical protein
MSDLITFAIVEFPSLMVIVDPARVASASITRAGRIVLEANRAILRSTAIVAVGCCPPCGRGDPGSGPWPNWTTARDAAGR